MSGQASGLVRSVVMCDVGGEQCVLLRCVSTVLAGFTQIYFIPHCDTFVCRYSCHLSYSVEMCACARLVSIQCHPAAAPLPFLLPPPPLTCSLALTLFTLVDPHTSLRRRANPTLGALSSTPRAGLQTARPSALRSSDAIRPCVGKFCSSRSTAV
jgi:hypothetical protein